MIRKVYLSGGMTGRTRAAYVKEFGDAEKYLQGMGFKVKNPARFPMARWPWLFRLLGYKLTLFVDLIILSKCDAVVELESADRSKGARTEIAWAEAVGLSHWALLDADYGFCIKIFPK